MNVLLTHGLTGLDISKPCLHHADALTRPTKSIVLSQTLQEYLSKNASIASVATQLAGERDLYILSASWRMDSALCVWHTALAIFSPLRRILGWKSVFLFSSPGSWCNHFNSALVQVHRVCLSSLLFPAPVLCWLSITCALPQGNYPGRIQSSQDKLSQSHGKGTHGKKVSVEMSGAWAFMEKLKKLGSKLGAHPLLKQPSHPFPF